MVDIACVSILDDDDNGSEDVVCVSECKTPVSRKRRRKSFATHSPADVLCVASDAALAAAAANAQDMICAITAATAEFDDVVCVASDAELAAAVANAQDFAAATAAAPADAGDVSCVASHAALAAAAANLQSLAVDADAVLATAAAEAEAHGLGLVVKAFECQCCFEQVPPLQGLYMSARCNHMMCCACFQRYASGQIESRELCRCPLCPAASANVVPGWLIQRTLGTEAADANSRNEQIHLGQVDGGKISLWQCPMPDCTNRHVLPEGWDPARVPDAERVVDCRGCGKHICLRCDVEDHVGFSCEQFVEWRKANSAADTSYAELLTSGLIKPCPNCAAPILKTEGCNFMTCTSCKCPNGMCWETGKARWGPNGCGGGHHCH